MVTVKISEKDGQQTTYQFDKPEVTIGRMKGNDIVLPKGNVSKKHARLIKDGATLKVDDLNSTNGTYVNGRKVTAQTDVSEDDKIYIGDFILQLQPDDQQAQQGPPSPPGADSKPPAGGGGGPTNPPNPSGPGQSSPGGDRPKPPSGSSRPNAGPTAGGPSADSPDASSSQNKRPDASNKADRGNSGVSGTPAGSASGTSQGPGGSPGGSGASSLDKRFSSSGSTSDAEGTPDRGSPAPESHDGAGQSSDVSAPSPPESGGTPRSGPSQSGPSHSDASPSVSPEPTGRDDEERPAVDRNRVESPVDASVSMGPTPLTDAFDDDLHQLHRDAARALLDAVGGIDELPIEYPAADNERTSLSDVVSDALDSIEAGPHADRLQELLLDEAVGLGPIEQLLDDPDVDAIYVNDYDRVITRRGGDIVREDVAFGHPDLLLLAAERLLGERNPTHPADRVRFSDGTTARVVAPPLAMHGPVLSIESPVDEVTLDDMVQRQILTEQMAGFTRAAVIGSQTMLVVGADDHTRQQLLAGLCHELPDASRTVGVSESELTSLDGPNTTQLDASPGGDWSRQEVVRAAHQLNPERVVIDELQGAEACGWTRAAIGGAAGSMATIYGQNLEDGLDRLYAAGQAQHATGGPLDRQEIATAVDIVVWVSRPRAGQPRVMRIAELEDLDYDRFRLNDIFRYRVDDDEAEFVATGFVPSFYKALNRTDDSKVPSDLFGQQ